MQTTPVWKKTAALDALNNVSDEYSAQMTWVLKQDPRWLETFVSDSDKKLERFIAEQSDLLCGSATFLVHSSALRVALSDWTLFSRAIRRYTLFASPLLNPVLVSDEFSTLCTLFEKLHEQLKLNEVLFLQSVASDSHLGNLLYLKNSPIHKKYYVLKFGKSYKHRYINLPDDYTQYLAQLSASTRADLKRTRKRFIAKTSNYKTICYQNPNEITAFLDAAMAISTQTYQYKLLGGGLRERLFLKNRYTKTANLSWFRSYVLFANDEPIAFQVGHLYNGCYHAQEIGYMPDWAKLQAGIFLHTEIISDLLTVSDVKRFDFGNDDNTHKQRLSNAYTTESYVYLLPRRWQNSLTYYSMCIGNCVSNSIGRFLENYGLRERMRKFLWKLGVMK